MTAPEEIEDRTAPGHWEGDLVVGKQGKTAMGTLVERNTRYFVPIALPDGPAASSVREAHINSIEGIPLRTCAKSIPPGTRGRRWPSMPALTLATDIPAVYFAHAHSPWERVHEREHQPTCPRILPERDRNHF